MKKQSIWNAYSKKEEFKSLKENIETDVLIVGGGIVGILCAYELKQRNINCIIVEKNKIGQGNTKNTTAFITAQHETLYQDLIKEQGITKAKEYLELNLKALKKYKELSNKYYFDYEECSSTLFTSKSNDIIIKEKEALEKLNFKTEIITKLPIDIKISSGISFPKQAIINPLKLIYELSKELTIYENTEIVDFNTRYAITKDNIRIKFNNIVIATNYPFKRFKGLYFMKLTQTRSYVASIKYKDINGTYCSIDKDGLYFRKYKDNLIIGGNDRDLKDKQTRSFINRINRYMNIKNIDYIWSGQDCMTLDGIPYIGKYSLFSRNQFIVTGFNLWGFTWAMASSFMIADMIQNKKEYTLTNPQRYYLNKKLVYNIGNSIKNLVNFKTPRCSHLGCALQYNKKEKVWECPCHGSRYNNQGEIIDGPAMKNINVK